MAVTITTLVENTKGNNNTLRTEHGLSFLIRTEDENILFDTGSSDAFLHNAEVLGEDVIRTVTKVVLSHSHYDHTEGLPFLLDRTEHKLSIHVGKGFFTPKYGKKDGKLKYQGSSFSRQSLEDRGHKIYEHTEGLVELSDNVFIVTNFTRKVDTAWINQEFLIPAGGEYQTDPFDDEISLILRTPKGLVLIVGCSHPGILNIISTAKAKFPEPMYAVLGGTHLIKAKGERLEQAVKRFSRMGNTLLGLSHCTGDTALELLKEVCPNFFHNHTGNRFIIE